MTFKTFILSKKPLWVDGNLRLTVDEMFELHDEWMNTAELKYYGGNGYDGIPDNGAYLVTYYVDGEPIEKEFMSLRQARALYDGLKSEKSLWDIRFAPELLESHALVSPDMDNDLPF